MITVSGAAATPDLAHVRTDKGWGYYPAKAAVSLEVRIKRWVWDEICSSVSHIIAVVYRSRLCETSCIDQRPMWEHMGTH